MAIRVRRSVWSLPAGDQTISWYRKAVAQLITRPATDPNSWRYLAAIHGVPSNMQIPGAAAAYWDQCQHQSWFFLPWHRGYLASFEAVIAKTVVELGGPAEWALPYWDYSEPLTSNPKARIMPPDFFDRVLPGSGQNALWSRRAQVQNGNFNLDDTVVTLAALRIRVFTNATPGLPSGFGGPVTGFNNGGGDNGALENLPHNRIHTRISGFMGDPATAALDPIFWLHHCNIDRLWEIWRNQGPQYQNPASAPWLTAVSFGLHDANRNPITFVPQDMIDTTRVMHGYRYDMVPAARELPGDERLEVAMAREVNPELAGASDGPVPLEGEVTRTLVEVRSRIPEGTVLESIRRRRVYLNLENITGTGMPGDFKVYVDLPKDNKEAALAGIMTTFGLERASDRNRSHGGSGLNQVFEITDLAERLGLNQGTVSHLQITFVREGVPATENVVPEGLQEYVSASPRGSAIRVGRVSLFYG